MFGAAVLSTERREIEAVEKIGNERHGKVCGIDDVVDVVVLVRGVFDYATDAVDGGVKDGDTSVMVQEVVASVADGSLLLWLFLGSSSRFVQTKLLQDLVVNLVQSGLEDEILLFGIIVNKFPDGRPTQIVEAGLFRSDCLTGSTTART